jgi:hypothetical protein
MEKIARFRAYHERSLAEGQHEFVASTAGVKRDGLTLNMEGALLDPYLANPVVLWAHDYRGQRLPIGRTTALRAMKKELRATVQFDLADPFAAEVSRKYDEKFLNAVSIGWIDREYDETTRTVVKWEMIDLSAVPVPADADALLRREYAALRALFDGDDPDISGFSEPPADEEWPGLAHHAADGEVHWPGVAAAMARLLTGRCQVPAEERQRVWNHLERHYRKAGYEAPELRDLTDLPPDLQAGALVNGEWKHLREQMAVDIIDKVNALDAAIAAFKATEPPPAPAATPDEPELVEALAQVADALKE